MWKGCRLQPDDRGFDTSHRLQGDKSMVWSIRCWDKFVDYYYAEIKKVPDWLIVVSKRYSDDGRWRGL